MVTFQVMKNDLRRRLGNHKTYLVMILIPVMLILAGSIQLELRQKEYVAGVMEKKAMDMMCQLPGIRYQKICRESMNTELIFQQIDGIVDPDDKNTESELRRISEQQMKSGNIQTMEEKTMRSIQMLLLTEMMAAVLYAVVYIRDRRDGMMIRCSSCGVSRGKYKLGIAVSTAVMIGVQTALSLMAFHIFEPKFQLGIGESIAVWGKVILIALGFAFVIVSLAKKEIHAELTASTLILISALLGGMMVPVESMPEFLQYLSILSPLRLMTL